jgi:hypothetical protein
LTERSRLDRREPLALAGVAAVLTAATYLHYGYAYGGWPGTAMLDFVLRVNGELQRDWQTDQPAPHFAVTHFLALFPDSWLEGAVLALWIAGLLVLWGAFALLVRSLGGGHLAALGAGLVAIPTGFGGIGWSEPLFGSMYPSQSAFAVSVAALAAAVRGRSAAAAVLVGIAMLLHPSAGALAVPLVGVALVSIVGWSRRHAIRFLVPLAVLGIPAVLPIAIGQGQPSSLSTRERFELLALVRQPHHVLFSRFEGYEYLQTTLWGLLGVVAIVLLRHRREALALAVAGVAALVGLGMGALASAAEAPLLLLQAQLGRLSPFVVLIGIVAGSVALVRAGGLLGLGGLFAAPLLAPAVANSVSDESVSVSGVEAGLLLAVLAVALAVEPVRREVRGLATVVIAAGAAGLLLAIAVGMDSYRTTTLGAVLDPSTVLLALVLGAAGVAAVVLGRSRIAVADGAAFAAVLFLANGAALLRADGYNVGLDEMEADWRAIAAVAREVSAPEDVILTPPHGSGFRFHSHRAVVVEFGSFRYDSEDVNWARRIADATGDPRTVDPDFGGDAYDRNALLAEAYDRRVESSSLPVCRYGAAYVVAQTPVAVPAWLEPVAANDSYELLRVKPGACQAS